jgi:hypothetical protein
MLSLLLGILVFDDVAAWLNREPAPEPIPVKADKPDAAPTAEEAAGTSTPNS